MTNQIVVMHGKVTFMATCGCRVLKNVSDGLGWGLSKSRKDTFQGLQSDQSNCI